VTYLLTWLADKRILLAARLLHFRDGGFAVNLAGG